MLYDKAFLNIFIYLWLLSLTTKTKVMMALHDWLWFYPGALFDKKGGFKVFSSSWNSSEVSLFCWRDGYLWWLHSANTLIASPAYSLSWWHDSAASFQCCLSRLSLWFIPLEMSDKCCLKLADPYLLILLSVLYFPSSFFPSLSFSLPSLSVRASDQWLQAWILLQRPTPWKRSFT